MNIVLWILQVLLAVAFAAHGWMLVSPPADLVDLMNEQMGVGFRIFLGIAELLAAIGLVLPGLTRILPWMISVTAICLMIVVGSATFVHISRGETGSAITTGDSLCLVRACRLHALESPPDCTPDDQPERIASSAASDSSM